LPRHAQQLIDRGLTQQARPSPCALWRAPLPTHIKLDPPVDVTAMRGALRVAWHRPVDAELHAMRALGDPTPFRTPIWAFCSLKLEKPAALLARAEAWRPYRATPRCTLARLPQQVMKHENDVSVLQ